MRKYQEVRITRENVGHGLFEANIYSGGRESCFGAPVFLLVDVRRTVDAMFIYVVDI